MRGATDVTVSLRKSRIEKVRLRVNIGIIGGFLLITARLNGAIDIVPSLDKAEQAETSILILKGREGVECHFGGYTRHVSVTDLGGHLDLGGDGGTCGHGEVDDEGIGTSGVILELRQAQGIFRDVAKDGVVRILEDLDGAAVVGQGHSRWHGAGNTSYNENKR
jgi:hypothetical protein